MIIRHTSSWPAAIIALSILVSVAWVLRMAFLPRELLIVTDQARTLLAGRNILFGDLMLIGPRTSVGSVSLGPLYYYLTAAALWLSHFNPMGPTLMTIGMSVITAAGLFLWLKSRTTFSIAFLSSLFFATSPLIIQQSRLAIEPTPLPLFTLLWIICTERWLATNNHRWLIAVGFILFCAVQLNLSAALLVLATGYLGVRYLPTQLRRPALITCSMIIGVGVLLKYFLRPGFTTPEYLAREWLLLTTPHQPFVAAFFLFCAGIGIYRLTRFRQPWSRVILTLLAVSLIGFFTKTVAGDHALGMLFPTLGLLIALGLEPLLRRLPNTFALLSTIIFFLMYAVLLLPLLHTEVPYQWQEHLRVAQRIIELSDGEPYTFVYRGHLDIYDSADDHFQYALWLLGHPPAASFLREVGTRPEHWLLDRAQAPPHRTVYLTFPLDRAVDPPKGGKREVVGSVVLDLVP